jgi:hypothetical protein
LYAAFEGSVGFGTERTVLVIQNQLMLSPAIEQSPFNGSQSIYTYELDNYRFVVICKYLN